MDLVLIVAALGALLACTAVLVGVLTVQNHVKQKRVRLTLAQKRRIAERLKHKENVKDLAEEYGCGVTQVRRARTDAVANNQYADKYANGGRKNKRRPAYEEVDEKVYALYLEQRAMGVKVSGAMITAWAKASAPKAFQCSHGWVQKFKDRHGIGRVSTQGEQQHSADVDGALAYILELEDRLREEGYDLEDVYNMEETGICWRSLPKKTLVHDKENRAKYCKLRKDRLTAIMCANATGTHRLKLTVIGRADQPRCFTHPPTLVRYRGQKNARVNAILFSEWLEQFALAAEMHQLRHGRSGKVLLLVRDCMLHKLSEEIMLGDKFRVELLPPNATSLIQPMDQGVIDKTKKLYQAKFLGRVVQCSEGLDQFYKIYNLKHAVDLLQESWSELTQDNLRDAWKKLLPTFLTPAPSSAPAEEDEPNLVEMLGEINGDITNNDVNEWLAEIREIEQEVMDTDTSEGSDDEGEESDATEETKLREAFEKIVKWAKNQPDLIKVAAKTAYDYYHRSDNPISV